MTTWHRLTAALLAATAFTVFATAPVQAQARRDALVLGMVLEPPVLGPDLNSAAAISEVTHYNLFEGLTKIREDGSVVPLLAASWTASSDLKTWTFKLKPGVKFHDGTAFDSADVKFTYERYGSEKSVNKAKTVFTNMEKVEAPDPATVIITLKQPNPLFLFALGENTAIIQAPESVDSNGTKPIGTGPWKFDRWVRGDSVTLVKAETYREPAAVRLNRVTFKFINDPNAAITSLLAGDVDFFPQFNSLEAVDQFRKDARFNVSQGTTEGDTILAMNNKKAPLNDVRVRRAISHALDRAAIIEGAMSGFGTAIGTHFPPHNPAYVDLTGLYRHDVAAAKKLLAEAGFPNGLELTLKLPPPPYARRSGEIIAAQLAQVGIRAKIENMEFAQWLERVFRAKDFDLSIISHVEPNDLQRIYRDPNYYFGYDNADFNAIVDKLNVTLDEGERVKLLQAAQRKVAEDAVNGFLFNLPRVTIAKKGLAGFWKSAPIFANDLTGMRWE